ncbi:hypothetical protein [Flavivirga algicola]|uniref:DUF1449 family protein n=1 Tax=Flavivirga algicola TaxID=2729136 RepID=A0ABX1RZQ5_9FLAO|nr:hypothetical protein [Flavivirga algicola]NMH88460.1 hypothetical protein [Flavivirga algicola]
MNSIIEIAFSSVNIVLSLLVILLIIYWLFTMISGIDFDVDVDIDVDIDADVDVDVNTNLGSITNLPDIANVEINKEDIVRDQRKKLEWWQMVLIYFNFVGLPFMFTFTCWVFIWWLCTVISTSITGSYNTSFGYTLLLAGILPSLILTKIITTPFKSFFKNLNKDGDLPINLTGRKGIMLSKISGEKMGAAEVVADGNPMSIYAKSFDGKTISYRQNIVIVRQSEDKNFYWVFPYEDDETKPV